MTEEELRENFVPKLFSGYNYKLIDMRAGCVRKEEWDDLRDILNGNIDKVIMKRYMDFKQNYVLEGLLNISMPKLLTDKIKTWILNVDRRLKGSIIHRFDRVL